MPKPNDSKQPPHKWNFFHLGGVEQVLLNTAEDYRNLNTLDQKLWTVLSCPSKGLVFDDKTLAMLDTDGDERIRALEVQQAVAWVCTVLKDPAELKLRSASLPLASINTEVEEGRRLMASARQVLANIGKPDAQTITLDHVNDTATIFAQTRFNGDGIVPADSADENDVAIRTAIGDIIACLGGETDRSGKPGVNRALVDKFFEDSRAYVDWWNAGNGASPVDALNNGKGRGTDIHPLGSDTEAAAKILQKIRLKVDDYFVRCRLAAYDPRTAGILNRDEADYVPLAARNLATAADELAIFPLAKSQANQPLPLTTGINPAWASDMAQFNKLVVVPLLGKQDSLSWDQWAKLNDRFTHYEGWQAATPDTRVAALGPDRLTALLNSDIRQRINSLIDQDMALEPEANAIAKVEQLIRYYRDLDRFLNNFVSFGDFYTKRDKAIFQAGTLYLDGRSMELCVNVDDPNKHSALAAFSNTFLIYCNCSRRDGAKMSIVGTLTNGDAGFIRAGRNGVFYDWKGLDWDATVVKVMEQPISIRQAFWSPYRWVARTIEEQIIKFSSSKEKALQDKASASIAETEKKAAAGAPAPTPGAAAPATTDGAGVGGKAKESFDISKYVGMFAAIGLALGALATALAAIAGSLVKLEWWQVLLVIVAIMLLISGPSMLLAFLKLRKRNLGPILDANGWAINIHPKIDTRFGSSLTKLARIPLSARKVNLKGLQVHSAVMPDKA